MTTKRESVGLSTLYTLHATTAEERGSYSLAYSISMTAENALILNSALILFLPPAERNISLTASIATETAR